MRILIDGAGALGSFYGALLARSGNDVAILARGERLSYLRKNGLRYQLKEQESSIGVRILDKLRPEDRYDCVLVTARWESLPAAEAALGESCNSTLLVLCSGLGTWEEPAGKRAIPLIPGVEAELEDGVAKGRILPARFQPTVIGAPEGADAVLVQKLKKLFRKAKLPCRLVSQPDSWQARRLAWLLPLAEAAALPRKTRTGAELRRTAARLRENGKGLREKGISLSRKERLLQILPEGLLSWGLKVFFSLTRAGRFLSRWAVRNPERIGELNQALAEYLRANMIHKK